MAEFGIEFVAPIIYFAALGGLVVLILFFGAKCTHKNNVGDV
jgi:hypothetical protein